MKYCAYLWIVFKFFDLHGVGGVGENYYLVETRCDVIDEFLLLVRQHEVMLVCIAFVVGIEGFMLVVLTDRLIGHARCVRTFAALAGKHDESRVVVKLCRAVDLSAKIGDFSAYFGVVEAVKVL